MPTIMLLIRHGETEWSKEDRFCGMSDIQLSDGGRQQARLLAARLADFPISAVYSSPLQRCQETAQIIASLQGLSVETEPDLRELDYGVWDGMRREEILQQHSHEFEIWADDPASRCPPQGETGIALVERSVPVVERLAAAHSNDRIAVVAHKAVNRLLICAQLGIPLKNYRRTIRQDIAGLNVLEFDPYNGTSLVKLNDTHHYQDF